MKNNIAALFAFVLTAFLIVAINPCFTLAWEQAPKTFETHQEINNQALLRFFSKYGSGVKYQDSKIYEDTSYWGSDVISNSLTQSGVEVERVSRTLKEWVMSGGHSADESHLWASVRHFYDPIAGHNPELTDHNWVHGVLYAAFSARDWTFTHTDNPFSWKKALEYYKRAMEIPEGSKIDVIKSGDFRDIDLPVSSPAEARDTYLGKAYRALGETMHMFADMTQPCHVRNDSHPTGDIDPLESSATHAHVTAYAGYPVDPRSKINEADNAETMFDNLAVFTNEHFYTYDTVCDDADGVKPRNWETPMPHPQFGELTPGKDGISYTGVFNGKDVPLVIRLFLRGNEENANSYYYFVPPFYSDNLSQVLLPIAVAADGKLIDFFFPTMKLSIEGKQDTEMSSDITKYFIIDGKMLHQVNADPEWLRNNLQIKYSGPAELWCERKGNVMHIQDIPFKDGLMLGGPIVYVGEDPDDITDEDIKRSKVENEDNIYLVIKAGGRRFVSDKYPINATTSKPIQKPTVVTPTPTPAPTGTGWYMDGAPFIQKNPLKDTAAYFGKKLSISDGSASGSQSWKEDVSKCSGTYTGSNTWTPPPSFMQPGSKINFTASAKTTAQNTCGSLSIGSACSLKVEETYIVRAADSVPTVPPSATGTYTVRTGSPGSKMAVVVNVYAANLVGYVTYNYTYK